MDTCIKKILQGVYHHIPERFRLGYGVYAQTRRMCTQFDHADRETICSWQFQKLTEVINYAWNQLPGYRELWTKAGFSPEKFHTLDDFRRIPCVSREMISQNLSLFSAKHTRKFCKNTTGGSSGTPLVFYDYTTWSYRENGFVFDLWNRVCPGIKLNDRNVILRGAKLEAPCGYRFGSDSLYLSSYDLDKAHAEKFKELIEQFKPVYLQAYPTALTLFISVMKQYGMKINWPIKAIMLGSEPLYDYQKRLFKEFFQAPLSFWYGHTERLILAGNCKESDNFHIFPHYGYAEVLNGNNESVKEGEVGELTGTTFWNFATPLIRYRTQDFAELGSSFCPECKRNFQILNRIEGRAQDFVIDKRGIPLTLTALIFAQHFSAFSHLSQMQLEQEVPGKVTLSVVPLDSFTEEDEKELCGKITGAARNELEITIKYVKDIPRTIRGKQKILIQHIDISKYLHL